MTNGGSDILSMIERSDAAALAAALDGGADADVCDRLGVPALALAAGQGKLGIVDLLLSYGAKVDRTSEAGNSALMAAAARGRLEMVERLLEAGADPKHKNKWGLGADDWAAWAGNTAELLALLRGG